MIAAEPPVAEIVVTAPVLPPSPADAAFSVQTLDPKALAAGARVDDALGQVSGFSLYRRLSSLGANPTVQGVSLRGIAGSAASRALVTLDGAPVNDPFGGWVIFNAIPSETLGSATVVRGAGAGAYGAGALTGEIALETAPAQSGDWLLDAEGGSLGHDRVAGVVSQSLGRFVVTLSASQEHDSGWDPIRQGRGPADSNLSLDAWTASLRLAAQLGAADAAARLSVYHQDQGSGEVGVSSRDEGVSFTASAARAPTPGVLGWRAQAWLSASNLANTAAAVTANQATATLVDNEYATPSLGIGGDAALRAVWPSATLEAGLDIRRDEGEDREDYGAVGGGFRDWRLAGGASMVGGTYLEGTDRLGGWLFTANLRADAWRDSSGHESQGPLDGAASLSQAYANRGGVLPSARFGLKYAVNQFLSLRLAAYSGFRPPTLNELYRPFRVGNFVTLANPGLSPERLDGAEAGAGGAWRALSWSATSFYNRLVDPVSNVTLAKGPLTDSVGGFIPAGGALMQRENLGVVIAYGIEADARWDLGRTLDARASVSWTHARVSGAGQAPQLDGLRPAETPAAAATVSIDAALSPRLGLTLDGRYEGQQFVDDLNQLNLAPSFDLDARLNWRAGRRLTLYVFADNLLNLPIQQNQTSASLLSYGPPRTFGLGLTLASVSSDK